MAAGFTYKLHQISTNETNFKTAGQTGRKKQIGPVSQQATGMEGTYFLRSAE